MQNKNKIRKVCDASATQGAFPPWWSPRHPRQPAPPQSTLPPPHPKSTPPAPTGPFPACHRARPPSRPASRRPLPPSHRAVPSPPPASRRSPPPTTGADPRRTYRRDDAAEGAAQQHRIGGVHEHGGHRWQRAGQRWGTGGERGKETAAPRAARRARVAVGEEAGYCLCTWTVTLGQQTHTRTAAASPVGCDGGGIKRASG